MTTIANRSAAALLRSRSLLVLLLQASLVAAALTSAWLLRFDFRLPRAELLWFALPQLIAIRLLLMPAFGLMHGWWRYTGIRDALSILKFSAAGSLLFAAAVRYAWGLREFPLSVYALEALLTFTLLAGVRLFSRMLAATVRHDAARRRLLLVGAGHAAQMIIREIQEVETGYQVVGCVDDNPLKKGLRVLGVPVLGTVEDLSRLAARERVEEILIAIPSASPVEMRRLARLCQAAEMPFRAVPAVSELIAGRATLGQARHVSLEQLLGRSPVDLDMAGVRELIRGRVVMVTGAAGSIGTELCRQIKSYEPRLLVCLDQNETGIFHLEHQLAQAGGPAKTAFCVADFCHAERLHRIFRAYGVEIVFHAAAYKHVPVMEANAEEAVSNNVFGLLSLLQVADDARCSAFVMISSDKAVNPANVMGCTKRVGELIVAAWPARRLRLVSVRFGNVLGSNGSVIPLFQEQIRRNQPITITHPDITRFFMTVSEAVSLVLKAFAVGRSGDILVLDMGEPVRIADVARTLARLSGRYDQQFRFIGLRPGEKLYEELFYSDERVLPSSCAKIHRAESDRPAWPELRRALGDLQLAVSLGQRSSILAGLRQIVPQFSYPGCEQFQPGYSHRDDARPVENLPLPRLVPPPPAEIQPVADLPAASYHTWPGGRLNPPTAARPLD
jgi:FlaA1/EpsC-like NDP-sugar epimerase